MVKGSKMTEEQKQRLSEAHLGNIGYKHTKETKKKLSKIFKGRKISEEQKEKIRISLTGRKLSDETKTKIGTALKGHMVTHETREKIRKSQIGKKHTEKTKRKLSKTVKEMGLKREKNPNWKGGRYKHSAGYVLINTPEIPKKYEHRIIMENILCRGLNKKEVVHHINGNKDDNRPENLMLFPNNKEHMKYHKTLKARNS